MKISKVGMYLVLVSVSGLIGVGCAESRDAGASGRAVQGSGKLLRKAAPADDRLVGKGATLIVHGLACPSCAVGVERQLRQLGGVKAVEMDVTTGVVLLEIEPEKAPTRAEIKDAVRYGGGVLVEIRQP